MFLKQKELGNLSPVALGLVYVYAHCSAQCPIVAALRFFKKKSPFSTDIKENYKVFAYQLAIFGA